MVLDDYRGKADRFLLPVAKRLVNINPNTISWLSFAFAVMAGVYLVLSRFDEVGGVYLLLPASVLIALNAYFDAIDGMVARLSNKASKRGDFLDHVLDRYADLFIIGGILFSPYCNTIIGIFALLGVVLTSYMGTQAQAVGAKRHYGGLLGRADRLVILIVAPLVQFAFVIFNYDVGLSVPVLGSFTLTFFDIVMIWFAVGGNITAIQRAAVTWGELGKQEKVEKERMAKELKKDLEQRIEQQKK